MVTPGPSAERSASRPKRRRRIVMASVILAAWALVLAWHVKREYFRPMSLRLAEASANLIPGASFYTVKLGDATIGYASSRIDTVPDGFTLVDEMRLRIRALGADAPANARTHIRLGERLQLLGFDFALRSDYGDFEVEGGVEADSVLDLRISAGGDEQRMTLPTEGELLLPQVMPLHFALGREPEPGDSYTYELFDPSTLERRRVTLEVVGLETLVYPDSAAYDAASGGWVGVRHDTVETWHVKQSFGGVEIDSWLDPDGGIVRATSALGYTIERTAFEIAWNDYRALDDLAAGEAAERSDVIERTAIAVGVELPRGERLRGIAVRLENVDLGGFDLHGDRQRLSGDTLLVRMESGTDAPGYRLPASPGRWADALRATPLIQTEDPEIRNLAREIVGDSNDPALAARRLTDWVYEGLEKEVTLSVPSARQVLAAGRGDCNEHTVLYVALARSVGLPARTAAGLVYVRGRFYYHAWPEVWLDGWVPVDPTLGQFPADASHLRFVVGGLARQVELVRLIGQLRLQVLSVEER